MKFNVMFVDDSNSVLESLQWIFMDEPYYLFSYDNPLDAINAFLKSEPGLSSRAGVMHAVHERIFVI